jgi:hypothetical protein
MSFSSPKHSAALFLLHKATGLDKAAFLSLLRDKFQIGHATDIRESGCADIFIS